MEVESAKSRESGTEAERRNTPPFQRENAQDSESWKSDQARISVRRLKFPSLMGKGRHLHCGIETRCRNFSSRGAAMRFLSEKSTTF